MKRSTYQQTNFISSGKICFVIIFSIAMAFLESAVVIYLRELYYPEGFGFPLKSMDKTLMLTELLRELATIIMLISIGYLSSQNKRERFAIFLLSFAVWDIFYYVFLKALLNWPLGLNDWDILFLLPLPWYGPVWAPVLISIMMILYAMLLLNSLKTGFPFKHHIRDIIMISLGTTMVLYSMMEDAIMMNMHGMPVDQIALNHVPISFNLWIYFSGIGLYLYTGIQIWMRIQTGKQTSHIITF
ncbi:MAG TPA: hypothetical protein VGF79_00175 [Bacteroidia bacterium]